MVGVSNAQVASKKLVVYCPHPLVFIDPIVKKFEAATGIQTEVVAAGTGELLKRIEAESSNPLGDVMWGGTLSVLDPSKKFFETYQSPRRLLSSMRPRIATARSQALRWFPA